MFQGQSNIQCYFCHSHVNSPRDVRNFRCNACGCWNRYDKNGEICSDEPAMHDESLNSRSFSKRASPSKNSLPTMFGQGPFCHTCQTNQMLIVNLLSNYLPAPTDPSYERRLEDLPAYRESLHVRYPPVCENCLPVVEDVIQRKNNMARSQALAGWLKETKGKERQRRVSGTKVEREKASKEFFVWRIRGVLWAFTLSVSVTSNLTAALGYSTFHSLRMMRPILPFFILVSVFWTAWDPTYSTVRKAKMQGRDVRLQGKTKYITLQMTAWASRLVTSLFITLHWFRPHLNYLHLSQHPPSFRTRTYFGFSVLLELVVFVGSWASIHVRQPPAIRLIDTHKIDLSRSVTPNPEPIERAGSVPLKIPSASEPDLFSTLSLSSKPVIKPPVFGQSSLAPGANNTREVGAGSPEDDQMDWSPIDERTEGKRQQNEDTSLWLRPQRFFAPEQPTGLESLFERTRIVDDVAMSDSTNQGTAKENMWSFNLHLSRWWWAYAGGLVLLLGIGLQLWVSRGHRAEVSATSLPEPQRVDGSHDSEIPNSGTLHEPYPYRSQW
ncbi:hypothetical protein Moror_473 [Moniliophthora roreri MCA 2997]|uniref:Ima1 N-terminal domain-containing protein n=1 Tax=Moniliophthora roreri (strain MCA 2997) TaxID=1381753 RepID=V2XW83_MONRO|nr:hypothetical protein Moror_473 [Moniliophthora roreri MCA 2997]